MAGVTVAVDANGTDLGPAEVAAGAAIAAARGVRVLLFGPAQELGKPVDGVEIVDAPVSIAKAPEPMAAARSTPEASIVRAVEAVAQGRADAFVSGGSTGAALAAALFRVKRATGIHRPALATPVPVPGHPVTLVDVGANAEVRPEHLVQGSFYEGELVVPTGTNHSTQSLSGNTSDHASGNGVDFGMVKNRGTDDGPVGDAIAASAFLAAVERRLHPAASE